MYLFFRKLKWLWLFGNRTSCYPILSVIILVINKSDSHLAIVWFCWSLVWLQTELDSTLSYYHYVLISFSALSFSFSRPILNNYLIENWHRIRITRHWACKTYLHKLCRSVFICYIHMLLILQWAPGALISNLGWKDGSLTTERVLYGEGPSLKFFPNFFSWPDMIIQRSITFGRK